MFSELHFGSVKAALRADEDGNFGLIGGDERAERFAAAFVE